MERRICGVVSGKWTKVIAWFQIIGSSILALYLIIELIASRSVHNCRLSWENSQSANTNTCHLTSWDVGTFVLFILETLNFLMGIVLLAGSRMRIASILVVWSVFAAISMLVLFIGTMTAMLLYPGNLFIACCVSVFILKAAIQGFTLWIVGIRRSDITASIKTENSSIS